MQALISRAEEVLEGITQREHAMAEKEQEANKSFVQMTNLVGAFDARLVQLLATLTENNDQTVAELLRQDEATEAQVAAAQQQLAQDQVQAHQQATGELANKLLEQQATIGESVRTATREATKQLHKLREREDQIEQLVGQRPGVVTQEQQQQQQQHPQQQQQPTEASAASFNIGSKSPPTPAHMGATFEAASPFPMGGGQTDPWAQGTAANMAANMGMPVCMAGRPSGEGWKHHVQRVEMHTMDLPTIADEKKFDPWRAKFETEVDDVWNGLEQVLKAVRTMRSECIALEFDRMIVTHTMRPSNFEPMEWSHAYIGKQLYNILFKKTDSESNSIVATCEKNRDGVGAYRLLSKHCDPYTFNTAGNLMEAITELSGMKARSVDELLSTMREMKKSLATHEKRVKPLPDAKTTWIPSTLIGLTDRECLTYARKAGASVDFDKMLAATEELRDINKSVRTRGTFRKMREEEREKEEEEPEVEDEEQ